MSKLTDIQYRIDQLDGGAFQNLCDAYLTCKGYGIGYSLGMRTGTNKTAKGNPDTYFLKEDGKYVFVMYTTQKDDFVKKALQDEDLEKTCFPGKYKITNMYEQHKTRSCCTWVSSVQQLLLFSLSVRGSRLFQNAPAVHQIRIIHNKSVSRILSPGIVVFQHQVIAQLSSIFEF